MTFAVAEACVGCKDTACVAPCPMGCFLEGPDVLAIEPSECIDCAMCVPECPVDAIRADIELTPGDQAFVALTLRTAHGARGRLATALAAVGQGMMCSSRRRQCGRPPQRQGMATTCG